MKPQSPTVLTAMLMFSTFLLSSVSCGQPSMPESRHYKLEKLADGVFAAINNDDSGYAICNAGIIDLGDKTIVIDPTFTPAAARDLKLHAELLTGKAVSMVLDLDPHSDHTNGNQVFVPGADIISTPNARRYIEDSFQDEVEYYRKTLPEELDRIQKELLTATGHQKSELSLWESEYKAMGEALSEMKMTLPNIVISDTMVIHGTERTVIVIPTGTGHTTGDMIAWLPEEKIIFMSDQLFIERHPYFGDGDPESLRRNLVRISALGPLTAVPGHGPVGDLYSIFAMIDYIDTLTAMVDKEIQQGTDEDKIMQLPMPEKYNDWLINTFFSKNLRFLYLNKAKPLVP